MKLQPLSVSLALFLTACATTAGYEAVLNTWVGSTDSNLIDAWGPPDNTYTMSDGRTIVTYSRSQTTVLPGITYTTPQTTYSNGTINGDVNASYSGTTTTYVQHQGPAQVFTKVCVTRFTVSQDHHIESWRWEGNACKARAPSTEDTDISQTQDKQTELRSVQQAATEGDASAQARLGAMYFDGNQVPKSYPDALKWLNAASDQGNADAQYQLGIMYLDGYGVTKNEGEAAKLFTDSAEQGNIRAQKFIAYLYETGLGVNKDKAKAIQWYRKAAAQGDVSAKKALTELGGK